MCSPAVPHSFTPIQVLGTGTYFRINSLGGPHIACVLQGGFGTQDLVPWSTIVLAKAQLLTEGKAILNRQHAIQEIFMTYS